MVNSYSNIVKTHKFTFEIDDSFDEETMKMTEKGYSLL